MDALPAIDPAHLPWLAAGCGLLCLLLFVVAFFLQALDTVLSLLQSLIDFVLAGPSAWLGCGLLALTVIGIVLAAILLLQAPENCAAYPTNFCQWLGYLP